MRVKPSASTGSYIKPGKHILTIGDKVGRGRANTGTPFLEFTFYDTNGASVRDTFYLSAKALFRLARLVELTGGDMDSEIDTDDDGQLRMIFGGKAIGVLVVEEEYTRNDGSTGTAGKVKAYMLPSDVGANGASRGAPVQDAPGDDIPF